MNAFRPHRRGGVTLPRQPEAAGFTLIELLVALVILGLVMVMITSGLSFLGRAEEHRSDRAVTMESALGGLGALRASLSRAQPIYLHQESGTRLLFEGDGAQLRFIGREPDFVPGAPLIGYQFDVDGSGNRYRLEVRRVALDPLTPDLGTLATAAPRVLLSLPGPARFTYYGSVVPSGAPAWQETWQEQRKLPEAVRLAEADGPAWPDIVVRLMLDSAATCAAQNGDAPECKPS